MSVSKFEAPTSSVNLKQVISAIFKHKWKLIICALLGFAAAASVFFLRPPLYEAQAKLLVRYVVDRSAIDKFRGRDSHQSGSGGTDC